MTDDDSTKHPQREILGIDMLRFMAALMVLAFHMGTWGFRGTPQLLQRLLGATAIADSLVSYTQFGWVGVQIFFVISGFIIAYSAERATALSFFRGRFVRLMPCVWVASFMCVPMAYFVGGDSVGAIGKLFLKSIILYPKGPWIEDVLWTLIVEIAFYAVILLLIYGNRLKHLDLLGGVIGLYSGSFWIFEGSMSESQKFGSLAHQMGILSWSPAAQVSLLHHGCFFGIGIGLWLLLMKKRFGLTVLLAPVMLFGCYFEIMHVSSISLRATGVAQSPVVPFVVWLAALAFMVVALTQDVRINRYCRSLGANIPARVKWLGAITYPLYLLHVPSVLLAVYCIPDSYGQYPRWITGLISALVVAAVFATDLEPTLKRRLGKVFDYVLGIAIRPRRRDVI